MVFKLGQGQSKCGVCLCFTFIHWVFFLWLCYIVGIYFTLVFWFLSGFSCGTKFSICYTVFALALFQLLCLSHVSWGPLHMLSPLSWLPTLLFMATHLTNLFPGFPLKHHSLSDNLLDLPSSLLNYCSAIVSSSHTIRAWSALRMGNLSSAYSSHCKMPLNSFLESEFQIAIVNILSLFQDTRYF